MGGVSINGTHPAGNLQQRSKNRVANGETASTPHPTNQDNTKSNLKIRPNITLLTILNVTTKNLILQIRASSLVNSPPIDIAFLITNKAF